MVGRLHGIPLTTGRLEDNHRERVFAADADEGGFVPHQDTDAVVEHLHGMAEVRGCPEREQPDGVGVAAHDLPDLPDFGELIAEDMELATVELMGKLAKLP